MRLNELLKSRKFFERAKKIIPGGVHSNARYLTPFPLYFVKAKDNKLWDVDGNEYVDYFVAHGSIVLGHHYKKIVEAVKRQMEYGLSFGVESELTISAAEDLVDIIPSGEMARFSTSGSAAIMSAIHIARGYTGRKKIIKEEGGWHGNYDYVCASYRPPLDNAGSENTPLTIPESAGFIKEDVINNTMVVPFNNQEVLEKMIKRNKHDIAALVIEPIVHNCGAIIPKDGYLNVVRELTEDNDILLIFDEVITGFRSAPGGAQEYYRVDPDISIFGKALANGYPISAIVGKLDILKISGPDTQLGSVGGFGSVLFGGTFNADHLTVAACKANLAELKDGKVASHLNKLTDRLIIDVKELTEDIKSNIRIQGLGGQFSIYFSEEEVTTFREAITSDNGTGEKFLKLQKDLQAKGIRLLPRHIYHHGFSYSHSERDVNDLVLSIGSLLQERT